MKGHDHPRIKTVDRLDNAVIVTFDDNSSATYPATLLHAAIGVADAMMERERERSQAKVAVSDPYTQEGTL